MNQRSSSELLSRFERHKTNWRTDLDPETVFTEPFFFVFFCGQILALKTMSILNSYQYKSRDTTFQKVMISIKDCSFLCLFYP